MATEKATTNRDGKGLKVVPKREGFRRAGHAFPAEGKTLAYADLTDAQIKQLTTEPALVAIEVELPKEKDEAKK